MNKTVATLLAKEVTIGAVIEMIEHIGKEFNNSYDRVKENHFADMLVGNVTIRTIEDIDIDKVDARVKELTPNILDIKSITCDVDNINMVVTTKAEVKRFGFFANADDVKHPWRASTESDNEHPLRAEYNDTVINDISFTSDIWAVTRHDVPVE